MNDYAVLVVNGSIKDMDFYKDILDNAKILVASDGAANILYRHSKDIDYIIGDLDSISEEVLNYYKNKDVTVKRYPVKKDKTDSEISIDEIYKMGIEKIIMIGAKGDRIDHFMANLNLLYYADNIGVNLVILDENNEITLIKEGQNYIDVKVNQTISFVSLIGEVQGITLSGFEYELEDYNLNFGSSILTSNVAKKERVFVEIKKGSLLCIKVNENL
ncbi:thiamine pyrophosphokinase [[Eubacterium] yurii]|jgi:thiamine diphosphokinase|nr:thiamine pyrophosphokinase [[Eubacterium] yurii]